MKDQLLKHCHWFIISYAIFGLHSIYETKTEEIITTQEQIPSLEIKVNRIKKKLAQINQFKEDLAKSEERVKAVVEQIEKIQKQLPTQINDTEVQEIMTNMSSDLKILEPNTSPLAETDNGFYFAKNYKYTARGTFLQFLIMFEKLEVLASKDRILNVKELKLTVSENSDKKSRFQILDFDTTVESFRYNPNYKEGVR